MEGLYLERLERESFKFFFSLSQSNIRNIRFYSATCSCIVELREAVKLFSRTAKFRSFLCIREGSEAAIVLGVWGAKRPVFRVSEPKKEGCAQSKSEQRG
jgi:hypothetical protein